MTPVKRSVAVVGVLAFSILVPGGPATAAGPPDRNAEGTSLSAVDQTRGIGVVAKTLPSPSDKNARGVPLPALDSLLPPAITGGRGESS